MLGFQRELVVVDICETLRFSCNDTKLGSTDDCFLNAMSGLPILDSMFSATIHTLVTVLGAVQFMHKW